MKAISAWTALLLAVACAWPGSAAAHGGAALELPAQRAFELGRQYRNGTGVERDVPRAATYFAQAAHGRHAQAMFTLSNMLASGEGLARDDSAARRWLEAAAQLEHPEALQQMALHLQDGTLGYARDAQRAKQLLRVMAHAMQHRGTDR